MVAHFFWILSFKAEICASSLDSPAWAFTRSVLNPTNTIQSFLACSLSRFAAFAARSLEDDVLDEDVFPSIVLAPVKVEDIDADADVDTDTDVDAEVDADADADADASADADANVETDADTVADTGADVGACALDEDSWSRDALLVVTVTGVLADRVERLHDDDEARPNCPSEAEASVSSLTSGSSATGSL